MIPNEQKKEMGSLLWSYIIDGFMMAVKCMQAHSTRKKRFETRLLKMLSSLLTKLNNSREYERKELSGVVQYMNFLRLFCAFYYFIAHNHIIRL